MPAATRLRNHLHVILILPLVIIVMTWPTFARIFDADEIWLHTDHTDKWVSYWVTWHLENVLAGKSDYFYSEAMYHPQGISLAYQHHELPHSLLFIPLKRLMPADDAYNLLFLLTIYFNAFCAYVLFAHLFKDRWVALFGAVAIGVSAYFPNAAPVPDIRILGTFPLTIYFYHRSVFENRWPFAALAGICAGITAFIGEYLFLFILISVGIYAVLPAWQRWRRRAFWLQLLLFLSLSLSIGLLRFYPLIVDAEGLKAGTDRYEESAHSNDILEFFISSRNPVFGGFLHSAFNASPDSSYEDGYWGYINLFFLSCAILYKPWRRKLAPWLVMFLFFACMSLGSHLSYNGVDYTDVVLPERLLSDSLPLIFRNIGWPDYYHIGLVYPLAALSCLGLAALLRDRPNRLRALVSLTACLIVTIEFYVPREGEVVKRELIAYTDFLPTEPDSSIKVINLPQKWWHRHRYLYMQTLTGYPMAFGFQHRLLPIAEMQISRNPLLHDWYRSRATHCLHYNEKAFGSALDQLLAEGFTHVVVHNWRYGDQFAIHTFDNIPAVYDDGFVSIYRLSDLRRSCESNHIELPRFRRFVESSLAVPDARASIVSFHPSEGIDADRFSYLKSLFSDWRSLIHLYRDDGELVAQSAGEPYMELKTLANDNQLIYLIYSADDSVSVPNDVLKSFDRFELCQRETHEDGSVIEQYIRRGFSCQLVASDKPFRVEYDNGAALENIFLDATQDQLDIQVMWSSLPRNPHSMSIQVFDIAGAKVLGQDSVIGHDSLKRVLIDMSALPPGEFVVKLIVYNYNTGVSVPGTLSEDGTGFERDVVVAAIDRP